MKHTKRDQRRMAAAHCAAVAIAVAAADASAQMSPAPHEVQVGPVDVIQEIQGVKLAVRATSFLSVATSQGNMDIKARTFADLRDLQAKAGSLIDTFPLPRDNCQSYRANNPVVTISNKKLAYGNQNAVLTLGGDVDMWDCRENPVPNSKIEWDRGPLGIPVPRIVTWPGSPIKNKLLSQPVTATLTARLTLPSETAIQVDMLKPNVELGGNPALAAVRDSLLTLFRVDLNKLAEQQLRSAIDPARLQVSVPEDFKKLNPKITKASFVDLGALGVEIVSEARVSTANMMELIKALAEHKK